MTADMTADIISLESGVQRLRLVPELGGAVAAWEWKIDEAWTPLLRPWNGTSEDRYTLACFPLVPWSNRIAQGGFEQDGTFYPIRPNRAGEPYPIHGDGWLQSWQVVEQSPERIKLMLESRNFGGDPYHYRSTETFSLLPGGLQIDLTVTHLGPQTLPYGLGLHPYFPRTAATRLQSKAEGVWLAGDDPIPVEYTSVLPPTWDYNAPAPLDGPLIDNCFNGWNGRSRIDYPDRGLSITMIMPDCTGYSLMYRPPEFNYFCLEPITHPIDAFHMPERPGLALLGHGDGFALRTRLLVAELPSSHQ